MSESNIAVQIKTSPNIGRGLLANAAAIDIAKSASSPSNSIVERSIFWVLLACAFVSVATTFGILATLLSESLSFFEEVSLVEFFTGKEWFPLLDPRRFGVLPLVWGSIQIALGSLVVAIPLGIFAALLLSEYTPKRLKVPLKSSLEILAGIPTVVYGYFALTFITPHLQNWFPNVEIFNALSAAIVVGIMIVPTIASVSQDAFEAVPRELRDAAYGLGSHKFQVASTIVFPAALSGVVASVILAFSRAIGETMAVTLAAGATPKLTMSFYESIQTMTAFIVQVSMGDTPTGTIEYKTIFVVGLLLFSITLGANLAARAIVRRFQLQQ